MNFKVRIIQIHYMTTASSMQINLFRVETLQILNTSLQHPNTAAELRGNHEADYKIVEREGAEAEAAPKGEVLAQNTYGGCK